MKMVQQLTQDTKHTRATLTLERVEPHAHFCLKWPLVVGVGMTWWQCEDDEGEVGQVDVVKLRSIIYWIYWDFDCTGKCALDRYYASFRELESNFRPARVFHSAFAVTSYYAYLKQRMKTLFQISSLWATPRILYTPSDTLPYRKTTEQHTLALKDIFSQTLLSAHSLRLIY